MIKKLYSEYIQKSRIFLYPLLNIPKGSVAVPLESYVAWSEKFSPHSYKLLCTYYLRDDTEFLKFEKNKLLGNRLFDTFYQLEDDNGVYVFDFEDYMKDWDHFINGRYSQLSSDTKNKILKFFLTNKSTYHHVNSYLNPEIYYEQYSKLLNVEEHLLRNVKELCSVPDLFRETLLAKEKTIDIFKI